MATTYNAKLTVNCIKQHVCLGCDAEYQYHLERNVTGSGGSEEAAAKNAEAAAIKALENDVDQHACPHCGMMQPDMIAEVRKSRFMAGMWLAPIIILVAFFLALPHVMTISTSAMVASAGVVISLLCMVSGIFFNPNSDMSAGKMASADKVQSGDVVMTREGNTTSSVDDFSAPSGSHWTGLVLVAVGLVATVAPLVLPIVSGWEKNDSYPAVVGPGDTTCIYFDREITCLKGMWSGSVRVNVKNAADLGAEAQGFQGTTKHSTWGDTISGKSVSNETKAMWTEITVPDNAELAGKTADLDIEVSARFPLAADGFFDDRTGTFQHNESLTLSSPGSGTTYWQSWIFGQLGAIVLIVVGGFILCSTANGLVAAANTPSILVSENEDDEEYDEDGDDYEEEDEEEFDA